MRAISRAAIYIIREAVDDKKLVEAAVFCIKKDIGELYVLIWPRFVLA